MASGTQMVDTENSKATLKILQPPGGASSNIFGTDSAKQQQPQQPQNSRPAKDPLPATSGSAPSAEMDAVQTQNPAKKGSDSSSSSETPDKKKTSNTRKGFNPITGEAYDGGDAKANQQTAKESSATTGAAGRGGRQPPGGASSKLW